MMRYILLSAAAVIAAPFSFGQTCVSQDAVVYFVTEQSELTSQAQEVVKYMADKIQDGCKVDEVFLGGHTDSNEASSGIASAAQLANQRMTSVAQTMAIQGIDPNVIVTANFRDRRPAVKTAQGRKEPLNRRVEIEIKVSPAS